MCKTAFITGASSGFGRGFAQRLSRDGYHVGIAARRVELLERIADEIRSTGARVSVCPCDVAEREQVHAAISKTERELGPVDLLIANAGMSEMARAQSLDGLEVERMTRVNFLGAVYAAERVLPAMLDRDDGQLVAIGSLAGYGGLPASASYSATKGALHNFFESLRIDLSRTGVDVTVITPGYVRSAITDRNDHPMPFLMELDDAIDRMTAAIHARKRVLAFPAPLTTAAWLAQIFPPALYDWIASRVRREKTS